MLIMMIKSLGAKAKEKKPSEKMREKIRKREEKERHDDVKEEEEEEENTYAHRYVYIDIVIRLAMMFDKRHSGERALKYEREREKGRDKSVPKGRTVFFPLKTTRKESDNLLVFVISAKLFISSG